MCLKFGALQPVDPSCLPQHVVQLVIHQVNTAGHEEGIGDLDETLKALKIETLTEIWQLTNFVSLSLSSF